MRNTRRLLSRLSRGLDDITEEAKQDYLLRTNVANVPSRVTYVLDETVEQALTTAPTVVRQAALAIKDMDTQLHEQAKTVHGIKDLLLAQNRDVHVLAIKNLVTQESIDHGDIFPEDVRAFACDYHEQKKRSPIHQQKWGPLCEVSPSATTFARTSVDDQMAATVLA